MNPHFLVTPDDDYGFNTKFVGDCIEIHLGWSPALGDALIDLGHFASRRASGNNPDCAAGYEVRIQRRDA